MARIFVASDAIADRAGPMVVTRMEVAAGGAGIDADARKTAWSSILTRRLRLRRRIDAEFLPDVSELPGIGEAPVAHHRAQRDNPRLGEDQPRQPSTGIEPHQSSLQQPLGDR